MNGRKPLVWLTVWGKRVETWGGQVQDEVDWTNFGFILVWRKGVLTKEVDGLNIEDWGTKAAFNRFTNGNEFRRLGEIIAKSSSSRSSWSSVSLLSSSINMKSLFACPDEAEVTKLDDLIGTRLSGWKATCLPEKSVGTICKSSSSKTKKNNGWNVRFEMRKQNYQNPLVCHWHQTHWLDVSLLRGFDRIGFPMWKQRIFLQSHQSNCLRT